MFAAYSIAWHSFTRFTYTIFRKMSIKTVFVTVGTTKFDRLIETLTSDEVTSTLSNLGYKRMTLQIGNGLFEPQPSKHITIDYYRLKTCIQADIVDADLIISHAGAGSCLEILGVHKPLIVVINEKLMGNHQLEIATALCKRGYLVYCTCSDLVRTLEARKYQQLKLYPKANSRKFANYLDTCLGF